jgi:hypothetical protein
MYESLKNKMNIEGTIDSVDFFFFVGVLLTSYFITLLLLTSSFVGDFRFF